MPGYVLVAGTSAAARGRLAGAVARGGHTAREASLDATLPGVARDDAPWLVVADLRDDPATGEAVLGALRRDRVTASVPQLALLPPGTTPPPAADDHLVEPWTDEVLAARVGAGARQGRLAADLRDRTIAMATFARRAGHDLKSPLTVMVATAQTLARRWDSIEPAKRAQLLETLATGAQRAAALISDFVAVAAAGADAYADPGAVADARLVAEAAVAATDLTGAASLAGEWSEVLVSADALAEVFARLLDNARRHGCRNGAAPVVTITAAVAPGHLEVVVDDEGPGIDPAVAERLFEPFERGAAAVAADPDATGVGLAVVRRIVEQGGGLVVAGASPAGGARFRVVLPATGDATGGPPGAPPRREAAGQ